MRPESSPLYIIMPLVMLAIAVIGAPTMMLSEGGWPRYKRLGTELSHIRDNNDRLRREVEGLQRQVKALRADPREVGRIARDELGYLRPGEIVYQFPPPD